MKSELEFIVLLARLGNLSAAARALDLTPPAATRRLAQLEARLGVRLVNRTTRSLSLTSEGETYVAHATRILASIADMEEAVASTKAAPRGLLRINATLGFGRTVIRLSSTRTSTSGELPTTWKSPKLKKYMYGVGLKQRSAR